MKEINTREWLNPDKSNTAMIATEVSAYDASVTITDCGRGITLHADESLTDHRTGKIRVKPIRRYQKKIGKIIDVLTAQYQALEEMIEGR